MRPRAPSTIEMTSAAPLFIAVLIAATLTLTGSAHAAPFSFSASDAPSAITIAGTPAVAGDSICALDSLTPTAGSIATAGATCASIAADGSWSLEIDTSDFDDRQSGNLRIDYVLPSNNLKLLGSGVFWPEPIEDGYGLVDASDHRLVWIDIGDVETPTDSKQDR